MTTNIEEMGLEYSETYFGSKVLKVKNWTKFFPIINVQAEQILLDLATNYWQVKVGCKKDDFTFSVRINGPEKGYTINHRIGYKYNFELSCPYSKDDIRRYVFFNVLKQYNYAKICKDTQDVLIDLLVSKND